RAQAILDLNNAVAPQGKHVAPPKLGSPIQSSLQLLAQVETVAWRNGAPPSCRAMVEYRRTPWEREFDQSRSRRAPMEAAQQLAVSSLGGVCCLVSSGLLYS